MNLHFLRLPVSMILAFLFFSLFSCSKDTDLLSDYISSEELSQIVDIEVVNLNNHNLVIKPSDYGINGTIVEVSEPSFGNVIINSDNTMTYSPDSVSLNTEGQMSDEFEYEAVDIDNDANSTTSGTVQITTMSSTVKYWKNKFDSQYYQGGDREKMFELAKSGNRFQEYYYMYYYFDGLLSIWQATGDNVYLDDMISIIETTMANASSVNFNSNYLGWPADSSYGLDYPKDGVSLWESYYWKGVTTLLRMMLQSPSIINNSTYKDSYDSILEFTKKNIWNKWNAKGNSYIYRENVHMASHWARIGMELFIITGEAKYKKVFDEISFGQSQFLPSNMRERIRPHSSFPEAYFWYMSWESNKVEDTWHASDVVTFWILAYENDMYWNESDINALVETLDKVVFSSKYDPDYSYYVDGSNGFDTARGRLRDWLKLGRFNKDLNQRLINEYQSDIKNSRRYAIQNLANFALNEKYLLDGKPVFPEDY